MPPLAPAAPPDALLALRTLSERWYEARAKEKEGGRLARKMGLTLVSIAVFATVGAQVQVHHTSNALRSLSRAAITAEAAGDSRQLFNSRRVKVDLFELQRARIARELSELKERADAREGAVHARLDERAHHYAREIQKYAVEAEGHRLRAESLRAQSEAHLVYGKSLSRRANRLKDAVAWFQGAIAILALAVVMHNRWLWVWAVLASAIATTIYVTALVFVT